MASYITLTNTEFAEIMSQYGLSLSEEPKALSGGLENTSFIVKVKSNENYVLTVFERKKIEHVERLANLLHQITSNGFSTSRAIKNLEGNFVTVFKDKPILLKNYIVGNASPDLDENRLINIGKQMAFLHNIPAPSNIPKVYGYGHQTFNQVIESGIDNEFIDWLKDKYQYILSSIDDDLPKTLIHGDVFHDNIIINDSGGVTITDFEEACYYYRVFDLAMGIVGMCCIEYNISLVKAKALITGYEKVNALNQNEKDKLKSFIIYSATAVAFWRYRQYHIINPDDSMKNHHITQKNLVDNMLALSDEKFNKIFIQ